MAHLTRLVSWQHQKLNCLNNKKLIERDVLDRVENFIQQMKLFLKTAAAAKLQITKMG